MTNSRQEEAERALVLAASELDGPCIARELRHHGVSERTTIAIVAPVLAASRLSEIAGDLDDQRAEAQERVRTSIDCLEKHGLSGEGWVGDSDPLIALEDALAQFPADSVFVATHRTDEMAYAEEGLVSRAAGRLGVDVVHVVIDCDDAHPLREVEEVSADREAERRESRLRRWHHRDLLALFVGVVGTVVMGILAFGGGGVGGGQATTVIQLLIALGGFFLTFWAGAALMIGEAAENQRRGVQVAARAILVYMPLAVIASIVLNAV